MALIFCFAPYAVAEERSISTLILFHNDISLEQGGYEKGSFYAHWSNRSLGVELDVEDRPSNDSMYIRSSLTFTKGPISAVGGASTDNAGADYVHLGIWYFAAFRNFTVFFDGRNYWGVSGQASSYADNFLSVEHSFGERKKVFVGLNLVFDRWWGTGDVWYLAGPLAGYKITDTTAIFVRFSRAWDGTSPNLATTDQVRLGFKFNF